MNPWTDARITFMEATPVPASDAVTLIKLLFQAADSLASAMSDVLAELELTQSQARILWALDPGRPPVPMRELGRRLHFDPSNITLMADRLAAAGLVERQPHPTDGRQRVLALTGKGLEVLGLLIARLQQRSPIFTLSPEELTQLARLLARGQAGSGAPGAGGPARLRPSPEQSPRWAAWRA